jgi:hypothetical protein
MADWSVTGATPEQRRALASGLDDTRRWVDPNGYRLDDRLWRGRAADRRAIDTVLRRALAAGMSPLQTARVLEQYLTPEGMMRRTDRPVGARFDRERMAWVENLSGRGNYAARRLARTEQARAYGNASIESAQRNPWTRGVKWNLNQRHNFLDPCDVNATQDVYDLGPGVYPADAFPRFPQHPMCLCYITKVAAPFDEVLAVAREEIGAGAGSIFRQAFLAGLDAALRPPEPMPEAAD